MSVLNENQLLGASGAGGDYEIEQSLRFDKGSTPYLNRTFAAVGNRKTWTFSAWIKRAGLTDGTKTIFCSYAAGNDAGYFDISFLAADTIGVHTWGTTFRVSNQLFRDTSAWYHVVLSVDTTQGTASNRLKVYVNGDEITSWSTNNAPSQNFDTAINNDKIHSVGALSSTAAFVDGYMGEVNFIDGQALTPDSFGETGDYGEWKPTKYAGTYGTNGFYLPFEQDYTVEGFSTVVYEGTGATQYIGGTGFQPDFTWTKGRDRSGSSGSHNLFDAVRGNNARLRSDTTAVEDTGGWIPETDGFTLGTQGESNGNGSSFVAWNWDMGSTTASNTSGSITSSVRANTTYGQSIVSYTGNGNSNVSIGHGLGQIPDIVIIKPRGRDDNWVVSGQYIGAEHDYMYLNSTGAAGGAANTRIPNADANNINLGTFWNNINTSGIAHIAYCFSSVANYSKFGSYSGSGSSGNAITTGFAPAFVMVKRTDSAQDWQILDNTRDPNDPRTRRLEPNNSDAEVNDTSYNNCNFTSTGFTWQADGGNTNASGGTYIYMAFADTREYAYWYDQSGNNNDWTSEGGLTESDVMVDSPTNNFATLNPLDKSGTVTLSEGNLKYVNNTGVVRGTIAAGSGSKFYLEYCQVSAINASNPIILGIGTTEGLPAHESAHVQSMVVQCDGNTQKRVRVFVDNSQVQTTSFDALTAITTGGILMFAYDGATGKAWVGINGSWLQGNPATGASPIYTFSNTDTRPMTAFVDHAGVTNTGVINFGADSSFAGNKTPQGNQDSNDIGDFFYPVPNSYLALCTSNLPEVDVIPSEHFNTVIYSGNNSTQSITGVGFKSDLSWFKNRTGTNAHALVDSVRGHLNNLFPDQTLAELTSDQGNDVVSFDTDGFSLGPVQRAGSINTSGGSIVAWNWKAGGSASSNTNGSITSSVSANVDAGFSIVSYTALDSDETVGHGLSQKPEAVIIKRRNASSSNWVSHWDTIPNSNKQLYLNLTNAMDGNNIIEVGASTFRVEGNYSDVAVAGGTYIAYAFHSVEGYSKVGSYTGNGSTDGTFVHCGFRPAFVMVKRTNAAGDSWGIHDATRGTYNVSGPELYANTSEVEGAATRLDFTSNGFKQRSTGGLMNASGGTFIFLAFAETPFKFSNAR
jgi:hypothetical protein